MMKHIIFVLPNLRMGGAEKALVSLLKTIDPKRVNIDLFLFETGGVLQREVPSYVRIIGADDITRAMTLEMRKYFKDLIKKGKISAAMSRLKMTLMSKQGKDFFGWDIIKKHIPQLAGQYDVAIGFLEGFSDFFVIDKIEAKRKIGWIHIDMTGRTPTLEESKYYEQFDQIVTISEVCKKAFLNVFPRIRGKIDIIENIVLPEDIILKADENVDMNWDKGKWNFVSVGRLDYQKGFDIGAKAALILKEKQRDFCWHVYGTGVMKNEILDFVKENKLENNFVLEGLRTNPYPYMKSADIIVQPSRWEGKSLVLDEVKILGKAIVVTAYPSVTDQITDRETGIIVEITPEAIAEGLELLMTDTRLKSDLEDNCRREPNQSGRVVDQFYRLADI